MPLRLPFFRRDKPAFPSARDFPYVELRGGDSHVLLVPQLGGKIAELSLGGRQWLWHSSVTPFGVGQGGGSYVETADSGGFDECVPTVGACRVPGWVRSFGGVELPDHGELWAQEPIVEVLTSPEGQTVRCRWEGIRLPYRFQRDVRIDPKGIVHFQYRITNTGDEKLPFLWSAHPLFPLTDDTKLVLAEGARLRVFARHDIELGEVRSEHRWPHVRGSGKAFDFTEPAAVARRYACKLFLDVTEGAVALREREHELRFSWSPEEIPHVGIWLNKRGWTPFRDEEPYLNLAIEPTLGAPDTLIDALGDWKSCPWLDVGDTRQWSFRLGGSRIEAP